MQPDEMTAPALMSISEYAAITGQTGQAVRAQAAAGTCPVDVVILRRPAREGGRPRYGITRASVQRLLGDQAAP